ncbi:MAG: hypothetical protein WKG07_18405 [Hymenobacter sp.]
MLAYVDENGKTSRTRTPDPTLQEAGSSRPRTFVVGVAQAGRPRSRKTPSAPAPWTFFNASEGLRLHPATVPETQEKHLRARQRPGRRPHAAWKATGSLEVEPGHERPDRRAREK